MQEAIQHLVTLAQTLGKPFNAPGITQPLALRPHDVALEDLEKLLPAPTRIRQKLTLLDVPSFVDYVQRFASPATAVFSNGPTGRTFLARFDYHTPESAAWGDHTATYSCPLTVEWGNWKEKDRKRLSQEEFAQFIEDNIRDIVQPEGDKVAPNAADMLEISRTLQANKNLSFRQGIRLDNGQVQLSYNEEIDGRAGASGQLNIPEQFFIGIKPFLGGDAFLIAARFRYRIQEGRLAMWYELVRPDKVLEEAYAAVRNQIAAAIGAVPIYEANI